MIEKLRVNIALQDGAGPINELREIIEELESQEREERLEIIERELEDEDVMNGEERENQSRSESEGEGESESESEGERERESEGEGESENESESENDEDEIHSDEDEERHGYTRPPPKKLFSSSELLKELYPSSKIDLKTSLLLILKWQSKNHVEISSEDREENKIKQKQNSCRLILRL